MMFLPLVSVVKDAMESIYKGGTYNMGSSICIIHMGPQDSAGTMDTLPPPFYSVLLNCVDSFWKCKTIQTESESALMNQSVFLSGLFDISCIN